MSKPFQERTVVLRFINRHEYEFPYFGFVLVEYEFPLGAPQSSRVGEGAAMVVGEDVHFHLHTPVLCAQK